MLNFHVSSRHQKRRAQAGSQIAEFGAAVALLATLIIPLVNMVVIPIRFSIAQEIVNAYARQLALCETFSQSREMLTSDSTLKTTLKNLSGVDVESVSSHLRISEIPSQSGKVQKVYGPGEIPSAWLPDGSRAPCIYSLALEIKLLISPAILIKSSAHPIPGLTAPVPIVVEATHEWENLGRDPETGEFFINE